MASLFPMLIDLKQKDCLVVGGGNVAKRKVELLLESGAQVRVISTEAVGELRKLADEGKIAWHPKKFQKEDFKCPFLVVCATDDSVVNSEVSKLCREKGVPVNVVDDPSKCSFHVPAVLRRGDLTITVSTAGKSPLLARYLRSELETKFEKEYADYLELLGRVRERLAAEISDSRKRREILECLLESDLLRYIKQDRKDKIDEIIERCIKQ